MAQQKYASTDPNFGLPVKTYASTDPNFGVPAPQPQNDGLISRVVETLRTSPLSLGSGMLPPGIEQSARGMAADTLQALQNPRENIGTLGALAAQFIPAVRMGTGAVRGAAAVAPKVGRGFQALKNILSGAWRSGAGGGLAEGTASAVEGSDDALGAGLTEGALQFGADLLGGGLVAGTGSLMRGGGRAAGYKALAPSEADKAAVWLAEKGTPEGYLPIRGKRLIKDVMLERGEGSLGGETYAQAAKQRADATNAELQEIVGRTVSPQGLPKREFAIDRAEAASAVDPLARKAGGPGGGGSPLSARRSMEDVKADFLRFDPESMPFDVPTSRMLGEGTRPVPLASMANAPEGLLDVAPAAAIPNTLRRSPNANADMRVSPVDANTAPVLGASQTSLAPTSVLPAPPQFLGDAARVSATVPQPTGGTIEVPTAVARALGFAPAASRAPSTIISFENALTALRTIDDELQASMQRNIGAVGKAAEYVPSPSEQALMAIRRQLREQINAIAPTTTQGRRMAEINPEASRNIVWRDIAARATGDDTSGLKARAGVSRQGTPTLSLFENIYRFGGVGARPLVRGGEALQNNAARSPQLARLLYLLNNADEGMTVQPQSYTVNTGGIGR